MTPSLKLKFSDSTEKADFLDTTIYKGRHNLMVIQCLPNINVTITCTNG